MEVDRWHTASEQHWRLVIECEDRIERMRLLASSPLYSLWTEVRRELEEAAAEIEALRAKVRSLEEGKR